MENLGVLRGQCELTDDIIGSYFKCLASEFNCDDDIELVPPCVSFLLTNAESPEHAKENIEPMRLYEKKILVFPVNNCDESNDSDDGTHWSTLVYHSGMNKFVHLDTIQSVNKECATRLYEVVKGFVSSKPSLKGGLNDKKKKGKHSLNNRSTVPAIPGFTEDEMTPQQSTGYDCGLYLLAIAKTICQLHVGRSRIKDADWLDSIKKHVNVSYVESSMRSEVLRAVKEWDSKHGNTT